MKEAVKRLSSTFTDREKKQMVKGLIREFAALEDHPLMLNRNIEISNPIVEKVMAAIDRVNVGEPYQYVLGKTFFYDHEFNVDERALIPRPETEELVHQIVELHKSKGKPEWRILDIGTGTGCIAISLKLALLNSAVTGVDVSKKAIDLSKENAELLNADVRFVKKNILKEKLSDEFFDVIVSNPPYIPNNEKVLMSPHVTDFEPDEALFVEENKPLVFYERIAELGLEMLKNSGYLAFEIHENYAENIKKCLLLKGYKNICIIQDLQGKDRMIFAQLKNS